MTTVLKANPGASAALNWAQLIPSGPAAGIIASGLGALMIVLRFLTSKPATLGS